MSRNLGARNQTRATFCVSFVKNRVKVTIILVLLGLMLSIVNADKEPQEPSDNIQAKITELPSILKQHMEPDAGAAADIGAGVVEEKTDSTYVPDLGFWHAFVASLSVILVSELGDKTFFIAAIMAMRHPRLTVFIGAISALALMTVLSAVFGMAATIIPRVYTYYISTALFAIFGLKMLKEGYYMSPTDAAEELEEVQSDLRKREDELLRSDKRKQEKMDKKERGRKGAGSVSLQSVEDLNNTDTVMETRNGVQSIISTPAELHSGKAMRNGGILAAVSSSKSLQSYHVANTRVMNGSLKSLHEDDAEGVELRPLTSSEPASHSITHPNRPHSASSSTNSLQNRFEKDTTTTLISQDPETGIIRKNKPSISYVLSRIFMQAFTMTFLAEWGDRSQLTTIILGAREDVFGVIVGGVLGHSLCTGLAVIGGRMIAQRISVRTVTIVGGVVFLLFAFSALFFDPNDEKPMKTT